MKLRKYENQLRNLCLHFARQDGQDGKKWKENYVTKVTKIPKTKTRKYGMNEKQNKIKNQSCISTEKSIKSLKKTKTAKANLFFFSKNHHMNMIKMTGLKICNTTRRESKREKMWPLPIENSLLHNTTYHQIHKTQGAIFLFFKNENVIFSLNLFFNDVE